MGDFSLIVLAVLLLTLPRYAPELKSWFKSGFIDFRSGMKEGKQGVKSE